MCVYSLLYTRPPMAHLGLQGDCQRQKEREKLNMNRCTLCGNTHKVGGDEDGCQGDQGGHHHLGGDLGTTAPHDGSENLKHHPDEEHEVDVGQRQARQIEHTVLQ